MVNKNRKEFLLHEFFGMKEDGSAGSGGVPPVVDLTNHEALIKLAEKYNRVLEETKKLEGKSKQ
jgi:hypothetical protein